MKQIKSSIPAQSCDWRAFSRDMVCDQLRGNETNALAHCNIWAIHVAGIGVVNLDKPQTEFTIAPVR